ncbi:MAG: hypothetical protein JW969_16875 [Spirochaetales bacterium]|nr:hypothetical protein [Spirochaetales bacterium]
MRKVILISIVFLMVTIISCGAGGGKYGEVKKLMTEFVNSTEKMLKGVDEAKDGKAVAKALTEWASTTKSLQPQIEAMDKKYPELVSDNPPEELKDMLKEFEDVNKAMENVFEKIMQYADDPDVMAALAEMEGME